MSHIVDSVSLGAIVQVRDRLLKQQAQGRAVLRLESGDPSFDVPPHVAEAMAKAIRDGQTHYTASMGIQPLRDAIAQKVTTENRLPGVGPDDVIVTNGAMHGLYILFRALLEPGDEVILPDPMWTEVAENVRLSGGTPVPVRLDPDHGYQYDVAAIEAAITPRTKALFVNTPHNPTGAVASLETLTALSECAARHDVMLVSDEAYEHVLFDGRTHVSLGSLPAAHGRTVSVYSMSKTYAMSGLRLGYLAAPGLPWLMARLQKLVRCTINGVNSVTQHGAAAALTGPQDATRAMALEYQRRRDVLVRAATAAPCLEPFAPGGAFYLWCRITPEWGGYAGARDDWSMTNYLIDTAAIGSAPGSAFGRAGDACIRFAFSCSTPQVEKAAALLPGALAAK